MLADVVVALLAFAGVMVITAIIFGVWLIVSIVGAAFRIVRRVVRLVFPAPASMNWRVIHSDEAMIPCERVRCGTANPVGARYCRRCGQRMAQCAGQQVAVRRVAMW